MTNIRVSANQYWALLVDYLRPQRGRVIWLAALMFGNIGLQLVNPQIMRRFIDAALGGQDVSRLVTMALWFIGIAVLQQVVAVGATYVGENVSWVASNWLRFDLARHCLYLDMSFHNEHTPGEMIERIDGDVNALSSFFSQFTLQVLGNGVLLLGVLVLLFLEDVRVGFALTAFIFSALAIINQLRNIAVPLVEPFQPSSIAEYESFDRDLEQALDQAFELSHAQAFERVLDRALEE